MKNDDLILASRIKSGDTKSFEALFNDYYPQLTVFAKKYVHDLDIAKDIVQDFFVRLFDNHETLNIKTSLKSYLYQSVRNSCLNHINHHKIHKEHIEKIKLQEQDGSSADWSDKMMETELEHLIWKEVSKLPGQCQVIFKLSRAEGKKNKEIAEQLGISIRTVETQISKALMILRKNLSQYLKMLIFLLPGLNL